MMSDAEIEEAIVKLELGSLSRSELQAMARLALLSLRDTRKKLREYREREQTRIGKAEERA